MTKYNLIQLTQNSSFDETENISGVTYGVIYGTIDRFGYCIFNDSDVYNKVTSSGWLGIVPTIIYVQQNEEEFVPIKINPYRGMYELHNEKDLNLKITGIKVPLNINFTLEYVKKETIL